MKKISSLICAGMLLSALCAGLFACEDSDIVDSTARSPLLDCVTYVNTTPGEETILFAKGGIPYEESRPISESLKLEYGADNVSSDGGIPIEEEVLLGYEDYNVVVDPDAVPNGYEITLTIEFPDSSVPSVKELMDYGEFPVVRVIGNTAICKRYKWAFTQEGADISIGICERSYNSQNVSDIPVHEKDYKNILTRVYGGTIVNSTIKSLGPELHNEPIIF